MDVGLGLLLAADKAAVIDLIAGLCMLMLLHFRKGTHQSAALITAAVMGMNRIICIAAEKLILTVIAFLCMGMKLFREDTGKFQRDRIFRLVPCSHLAAGKNLSLAFFCMGMLLKLAHCLALNGDCRHQKHVCRHKHHCSAQHCEHLPPPLIFPTLPQVLCRFLQHRRLHWKSSFSYR